MKRLLLIDAYAMIYRAYYAFMRVPRITSKGQNTSAIFGFLTTLEDLKKKLKPTHMGVAFDPHGPTFRHEAFEAYKAQREETPEDIRVAVPIIQDILRAMNVPIYEVAGYEADDVIGTMAKMGQERGFEVFMATPDKDYGQLVDEHIYIYRPRHTSGFEQMGEKEVCEKYGLQRKEQVVDLLGLMGDAADNIPGCKGVGEKTAVALLTQFDSIENMLAHTDQIKGALRGKVESQAEMIRFSQFLARIKTDVPVEFKEDELELHEPNWEHLETLYREYEFNSLLKKKEGEKGQMKVAKKLVEMNGQLDLFGGMETSKAADTQLDLFAEPPATSIGNARVDGKGNENADEDLELVSYLLNPEAHYNPDCPPNVEELKANDKLWWLYKEVEMPLRQVLHDMEKAGVRFDEKILARASEEMRGELEGLEKDIYALAGEELNINSPKQVGELLFEKLALDDKAKKTKSGQYVTSEEALLALKAKHPIVGKILEYRELKKLISTYIDALPTYINKETGKVHATYNQTITATGRLSCSNPNLQNLPIRGERGKVIRAAVIPDEGCKFVSADYSQIELRLMAHFSQDEHMLKAFQEGQDIHAATAAKIFGLPIEEVSRDQRRKAKTANFGIIYGISAFGLSQQLDCSRTEAKQLIDDYFAAFPGVVRFIEASKERARQQGYVETLFGRKRYLPDINSHNATVRSFAERNAVNAPIQGTAADIIKIAMVRIHQRFEEEGLRAQMIMQVHDELNFNVPKDEVEKVKQIVEEEMQGAVKLTIPLLVDCQVGENWLEAH